MATPDIEMQRVEAEFQALNQTFGSAADSPLMAPSTLDVAALTLTLPINAPTATTLANLRYRGGKADVRGKPIVGRTITLTVNPPPAVDETADLIGVELTDNGYLTRFGTVQHAPPAIVPPPVPVSITAPVNAATFTTDVVQIVAATLPTGSLKVGSTFRITVRGSIQVKGATGMGNDSGSLRFMPFLGANVASQVYELAGRDAPLGPAAFYLEVDASVRTSGTPGTYVTNGFGSVGFSPADVRPILPATNIGAPANVDTVAPSPVVKLMAKWDKQIDNNKLQVDVATITQIV